MGLAMAHANESIMGSLPRAQAGVGSAVNDTTRSLGGALGVAAMGSVASSVFASRVHPFLAHVPGRYATQAQASVGAAVTAAKHAPDAIGQVLGAAARHAFIAGSDQATLVAVAAAVLGSLVALAFLPARAKGEVVSIAPAQADVVGIAKVRVVESA